MASYPGDATEAWQVDGEDYNAGILQAADPDPAGMPPARWMDGHFNEDHAGKCY